MFPQFLSQLKRAPASLPAKDYLLSIPESCLSAGFEAPPGSVRAILTQMIDGINPGTRLNSAQQGIIRENLKNVFLRYFSAREHVGEENAAFDRDMNLLKVVTFINAIDSCSFRLLSIARTTSVCNAFERFMDPRAEAPLISHEVDPERFSNAILGELRASMPAKAAVNPAQEKYLRQLLKAAIERSMGEVYDIGVESTLIRQSEWLLRIATFCSACTGR